MTTYFSTKELLSPPTERAAFSDRQAYVCAELSKLAYFKFEGGPISNAPGTFSEAENALAEILKNAEFTLVKTFSQEGTQAFFCTKKIAVKSEIKKTKTSAFLVFRGTEKNYQDIKTDISANLEKIKIEGNEVELHSGYLKAFRCVKEDIQKTLRQTSYDQLFITGHSLGGALAMVTTLILSSDVNGACYTFGAPPIGTVNVQNSLKTPVYEIINKIDIVPRLPNPWSATAILWLYKFIQLLAKPFTLFGKLLASGSWDERLEAYISSMTKYRHPGYKSYLVGAGNAAKLRFNVSSFDRLLWGAEFFGKKSFRQAKKMFTDHSIDNYISKLSAHGLSRNKGLSQNKAD